VTLVAWLIFGAAMLGMAWFPWCCCIDPPPCGYCSSDAETVAVTISGISNGLRCTNCTWFNATFILPRLNYNACTWQKNGYTGIACSGLASRYTIWAKVMLDLSSHRIWEVAVENTYAYAGTTHLEYGRNRYDSGSTAAMDCTATRSTTNYINVTDEGCAGYATMTVTINP
jgi:hypothetical protein